MVTAVYVCRWGYVKETCVIEIRCCQQKQAGEHKSMLDTTTRRRQSVCVCVCASLCRYVETPIHMAACKQCRHHLLRRTGKVKYMMVQGQEGREVQFGYYVHLMRARLS